MNNRCVLILTFDARERKQIKRVLRYRGYTFFCSPVYADREIELLIEQCDVVWPGSKTFKDPLLHGMFIRACRKRPIMSRMRLEEVFSKEKIPKGDKYADYFVNDTTKKSPNRISNYQGKDIY